MAARAESPDPELVELRFAGPGLDDLLEEEIQTWDEVLNWDFHASAELVRRYVALHALDGLALLDGSSVAGYVYWVLEGHKALLGDLFVRRAWRTPEIEGRLLEAALRTLLMRPGASAHAPQGWTRRVEGQLMLISVRAPLLLPNGPAIESYRRLFLLAPLGPALHLRPFPAPPSLRYEAWSPAAVDSCARLIARVYQGHIDSDINDQYRSPEGARRFLNNIVQYPGCGLFQPSASWILFDSHGEAQGLVLSTRVSTRAGHVAQVCVAPEYQGRGPGFELMRRAMISLSRSGAVEVSLTVTRSNERAGALYQRLGFHVAREFDAIVCEATGPTALP